MWLSVAVGGRATVGHKFFLDQPDLKLINFKFQAQKKRRMVTPPNNTKSKAGSPEEPQPGLKPFAGVKRSYKEFANVEVGKSVALILDLLLSQ